MPAYSTLGVRAVVQMAGFGQAMGAVRREIATTNGALIRLGASSTAASGGLSTLGIRIQQAGLQMRYFGNQIANVGFRMITGIAVPLALVGGAVSKVGSDFEKEMTKINTLVGVNMTTVRKWGDTILSIAPDLALGPTELARGLFVVTSAGIRDQAKALDVLVNSAKAARVGMGDVADVARLVTSIMLTYGDAVGDAANVTDMLIMAVREGNFEADKLATTFGRVISVAEAAGVTIADALGFIATFTRTGVPPDVAVTSLRAIMAALIKPTGKAKEVLDEFRLSAQYVSEAVGEHGLARTLILLRERMGETGFVEWISQIRGASGALAVTGEMAEEYVKIVDKIASANNVTAESFRQYTTTVDYSYNRLKAQAETTGVTLYNAIREPLKGLIDDITDFLGTIEDWAKQNETLVQSFVKIAAAFSVLGVGLAVLGKFIGTFGAIIQLGGSVITVITGIAGALGSLAVPVLGLVAGLGGFGALIVTQVEEVREALGLLPRTVQEEVQVVTEAHRGMSEAVAAASNNTIATVSYMNGKISTDVKDLAGQVDSSVYYMTESVTSDMDNMADESTTTVRDMMNSIVESITGNTGTIGSSVNKVQEQFSQKFGWIASKAKSWGVNIINQVAVGIIQGIIYIVQALSQLGQVIAHWLRPGSPPRLLPDLDKWGLGAANAYLEGWGLADVKLLNNMFSDINSYIRSFGDEFWKKAGVDNVAQLLLGIRDALAKVTNEFATLGHVTDATMDELMSSLGGTSAHVRALVEAYLDYEVASRAVAEAQRELNELTEHYEELLDPIDDRLREIANIGKTVSEEQRLEELRKILEDPFASAQVKDLARLEIEQIGLQRDKRDIEDERDAAIDIAEAKLTAAEKEAELAKERLEREQAILELAQIGASLLEEVAKKLKEVADELAGIVEGLGFGGGGEEGEPDLGLPSGGLFQGGKGMKGGESIFQPILDALEELRTATKKFGEAWGNVWKGLPELKPLISNLGRMKDTLVGMASKAITYFFEKFLEFLKFIGLGNLAQAIKDFFDEIKIPTLENLTKWTGEWATKLEDWAEEASPKIQEAIDKLFEKLEDLVHEFLQFYIMIIKVKVAVLDWIKTVFGPLYLALLELWLRTGYLWDQLEEIRVMFGNLLQPIKDVIYDGFKVLLEYLSPLMEFFEKIIEWARVGAVVLFFVGIEYIVKILTTAVEGLAAAWDWVARALGTVIDLLSQVPGATGEGPTWLDELLEGTGGSQFGTPRFKGGLTRVGEAGPELVALPRGSAIMSHMRTQRMLNASAMSGGGSEVSAGPVSGGGVNFYGPVQVNDPVDLAMFTYSVERAVMRGVRR